MMMKHQKKNKKLNKDHYHKLLKEYDIFPIYRLHYGEDYIQDFMIKIKHLYRCH